MNSMNVVCTFNVSLGGQTVHQWSSGPTEKIVVNITSTFMVNCAKFMNCDSYNLMKKKCETGCDAY